MTAVDEIIKIHPEIEAAEKQVGQTPAATALHFFELVQIKVFDEVFHLLHLGFVLEP